jgi:phosphatidylinositol alpha 1,6-mannosyltransferase
MEAQQLRVALFSGNYNYVRDGANQALNRLVEFLLRQGVAVRVYSPVTDTPAFAPQGDLVALPSIPFPGRGEYRFPTGFSAAIRADIAAFAPNMVHVSSPDVAGHSAVTWARTHGLPVIASVHTRFDTYPRYYGLTILEPVVKAILRRFYRRCDAILAPSPSMARLLREQRMNFDVGIWSRGIDRAIFDPGHRDMAWRRGLGIGDDEPVIGFIGRLVMEKGLDVFADTIDALHSHGVAHRVLVAGDGPARNWFEGRMPRAIFLGHCAGSDLGRAIASMDMLLNPSITETFGNVTQEALACGVPVIGADANGTNDIVEHGVTGRLIPPGDIAAFADAIAAWCADPAARRAAGRAGAAYAADKTWDNVNRAVLGTYLRLVRAG